MFLQISAKIILKSHFLLFVIHPKAISVLYQLLIWQTPDDGVASQPIFQRRIQKTMSFSSFHLENKTWIGGYSLISLILCITHLRPFLLPLLTDAVEILQKFVTVLCQHRLRMKLHAVDRIRAVRNRHHSLIFCPCIHLVLLRQRRLIDHQRMISCHQEILRQSPKKPLPECVRGLNLPCIGRVPFFTVAPAT